MRRGPTRTRRPTVWITVNFPEEDKPLYDAAKRMAKERRQNVSQFMRGLLEAEVVREEESDG